MTLRGQGPRQRARWWAGTVIDDAELWLDEFAKMPLEDVPVSAAIQRAATIERCADNAGERLAGDPKGPAIYNRMRGLVLRMRSLCELFEAVGRLRDGTGG